MWTEVKMFCATLISYTVICLETLPYFYERVKRYGQTIWHLLHSQNGQEAVGRALDGKIVIVTGANSGLGKATVLELVKRGAHVVLACRRLSEGENAIHEIRASTSAGEMELMRLDLASLRSVRTFAEEFKAKYPKLDILINNAGFHDASSQRKKTEDGFEQHIGVNHLGPFLLTNLLLEHLKKGGQESRVVTLSSHSVVFQNLNLDDLNMEHIGYGYFNLSPYANSKYANALFAKELAKRVPEIGSYSVAPGLVTSTFYDSQRPWYEEAVVRIGLALFGESPAQGCDTTVYLASAPVRLLAPYNGSFFHYRKTPSRFNRKLSQATDTARDLWELSARLVHV